MRCLVTGATGVLGSSLVRLLCHRGATVAALLRPKSDPWRLIDVLSMVEVITGDLNAIAESEAAIKRFRPDVVCHLGWYGVGSKYRDDPGQITRNVTGSLELLRIAAAAGCGRWVGLGSQAELGPHDGVLNDSLPARPTTAYGAAKLSVGLLGEHLCAAYGMSHCWLRLLAIYGPRDEPSHLIPYVTLALLGGQSPSLSPGVQRWDYLYVDDAAEAIWQAASQQNCSGTFFLGSGQAHTVRSIVEKVRDLIDAKSPLRFGVVPYRQDQSMLLQADIGAFQAATGWSPATSMSNGLRRTVAWFKRNRARYGP